jgi:hypothetical protein
LPEHDPEKREAVFRRDKRFVFARRSCSNNEPKHDESSSSHRALDARSRVQIISMKANSNEAGNQQQRTGRNQTIRERHSGPIKRAERCTAPNAARVQKSTSNHSEEAVGRPSNMDRTARHKIRRGREGAQFFAASRRAVRHAAQLSSG